MKTLLDKKLSVFIVAILFNIITHAQTNTFPSTGATGIGTITPDASFCWK